MGAERAEDPIPKPFPTSQHSRLMYKSYQKFVISELFSSSIERMRYSLSCNGASRDARQLPNLGAEMLEGCLRGILTPPAGSADPPALGGRGLQKAGWCFAWTQPFQGDSTNSFPIHGRGEGR